MLFAAILRSPESSSKVSRRLCTAEVRGSNPLGSTHKSAVLQDKPHRQTGTLERTRELGVQPTTVACLLWHSSYQLYPAVEVESYNMLLTWEGLGIRSVSCT